MIYNLEDIVKKARPIAAKHNVPAMYLFGSYARGEATEKSDIDFMVNVERGKGLFYLAGIYNDIAESFSKDIDLITVNQVPEDIRENFVSEAIRI